MTPRVDTRFLFWESLGYQTLKGLTNFHSSKRRNIQKLALANGKVRAKELRVSKIPSYQGAIWS